MRYLGYSLMAMGFLTLCYRVYRLEQSNAMLVRSNGALVSAYDAIVKSELLVLEALKSHHRTLSALTGVVLAEDAQTWTVQSVPCQTAKGLES